MLFYIISDEQLAAPDQSEKGSRTFYSKARRIYYNVSDYRIVDPELYNQSISQISKAMTEDSGVNSKVNYFRIVEIYHSNNQSITKIKVNRNLEITLGNIYFSSSYLNLTVYGNRQINATKQIPFNPSSSDNIAGKAQYVVQILIILIIGALFI